MGRKSNSNLSGRDRKLKDKMDKRALDRRRPVVSGWDLALQKAAIMGRLLESQRRRRIRNFWSDLLDPDRR